MTVKIVDFQDKKLFPNRIDGESGLATNLGSVKNLAIDLTQGLFHLSCNIKSMQELHRQLEDDLILLKKRLANLEDY